LKFAKAKANDMIRVLRLMLGLAFYPSIMTTWIISFFSVFLKGNSFQVLSILKW
jgi:hypothetical protein